MDSLQPGVGAGRKLCAPAAERNCEHIVKELLPLIEERVVSNAGRQTTHLLEVASGTGQHAAALAAALAAPLANLPQRHDVVIHPSDLYSQDGFGSIAAYAAEVSIEYVEVRRPVHLDCTTNFAETFRDEETGAQHVDGG